MNVFKKTTTLAILTFALIVGSNLNFKNINVATSNPTGIEVGQTAQANPAYAPMFEALRLSFGLAYTEYHTFGMNNNDMARVLGWRGNHKQMANACAERFKLNYRYSNIWKTDAYFIRK